MPTAREDVGIGVVNDKIYVIGGWRQDSNSLNTVEMYDPESNTWTKKADLPEKKEELGVAVVNGKIYAIGGDVSDSVFEYDPITNIWANKTKMPTSRDRLGVIAVNNKIYAIGGYTNGSLNIVEEYDPTTDKWAKRPNTLIPRADFGIAESNGKIYLFGGESNNEIINSVEIIDVSNMAWSTNKENMVTARSMLGATGSYDGKIYIMGGTASNSDDLKDSYLKHSWNLTRFQYVIHQNIFAYGITEQGLLW
jgi:N-acetylneuraminic acid mutarotase